MRSDYIVCKFLHASDLHIGKFQYTNQHRAMDFIHAFENLLKSAYQNSADFVILTGDVFNSLDLLPFYFSKVVGLLRQFHQKTNGKLPIITIEGNHDIRKFSKGNPISTNTSWLKILSNLELISLLDDDLADPNRNLQPICIKEVKIYGNSYCGEKIDDFIGPILKNIHRDKGFNILINHFGIEGQMKGVPGQSKFNLEEMRHYINYLGTGHFHKQYILDGWIFNPGCLSPACLSDFKLPHGYFFVEILKDKNYSIQITKKRIPERIIYWKTITIKSKLPSKEVLYSMITSFLKKEIIPKPSNFDLIQLEHLPVLCLIIRSSTGKLLSVSTKKALRSYILQNFQVIECHLFQKKINYKPIERFFPITNSLTQG